MENDDLASSGSVTPDTESVRQSDMQNITVSCPSRFPKVHSDCGAPFVKVGDEIKGYGTVTKAKGPLLVGRDTPHEDRAVDGGQVTHLSLRVDPACRLTDLRALMDTFGVELERHGKVFHRARVSDTFGAGNWSEETLKLTSSWPPSFDDSWMVTLFDAGEPWTEDGGVNHYRWPFRVDERLIGYVLLQRPDGEMQWWKFIFEPGREYKEPLLVGRSEAEGILLSTEAKTK